MRVYWTEKGKHFHTKNCIALHGQDILLSGEIEEALIAGKRPCRLCMSRVRSNEYKKLLRQHDLHPSEFSQVYRLYQNIAPSLNESNINEAFVKEPKEEAYTKVSHDFYTCAQGYFEAKGRHLTISFHDLNKALSPSEKNSGLGKGTRRLTPVKAGLLLIIPACLGIGILLSSDSEPETKDTSSYQASAQQMRETTSRAETAAPTLSLTTAATPEPTPTPTPTCDGITVTKDCVLNGVLYTTYIYHPAVPATTHVEQRSATEKVQTGTCTLCRDGTWSPTCAVGRGACSHHGGVAQYDAPVYDYQTTTWEETVQDSPAQDAYYETEIAAQ